MRHDTITHGNAGEFGKYAVLKTLPDKIAWFPDECYNGDYLSNMLNKNMLNMLNMQNMCISTQPGAYLCPGKNV